MLLCRFAMVISAQLVFLSWVVAAGCLNGVKRNQPPSRRWTFRLDTVGLLVVLLCAEFGANALGGVLPIELALFRRCIFQEHPLIGFGQLAE